MESSYCCSLWYHYTYLVIFWTNELEGDKRKKQKQKQNKYHTVVKIIEKS
jgi:hypothetical protein